MTLFHLILFEFDNAIGTGKITLIISSTCSLCNSVFLTYYPTFFINFLISVLFRYFKENLALFGQREVIHAKQSHTRLQVHFGYILISDLAIVGCLSSILFQLTHHLWGPSLHCIWTYAWSLPQLQPSLWSDCYPQAAPVPMVCRLERQPLLLCVSMEIYQIKKCNN